MKYKLIVHGGAGNVNSIPADELKVIQKKIHAILAAGEDMLKQGASSLDVVTYCATELENAAEFNAGKGSVMDCNGEFSMDAAIMDGRDINAGAVCGVRFIKNPIQLARAVMEKSDHVMLASTGAEKFAEIQNLPTEDNKYFWTEKRQQQWEKAKKSGKTVLDLTAMKDIEQEQKMGTIGAVAMDKDGNIAAATSTGGITNKQFLRVGDSPIIGAGVFADNESCGVSATGYGEQFLRTVISKQIANYIELKGYDARQATEAGIQYLISKVKGIGGVIVIDKDGNICSGCSADGMIHGYVSEGEDIITTLEPMIKL